MVCSLFADTINSDSLVIINDLIYKVNSNKIFSGDFINYHSNGQLEQQGIIENGKREGEWVYYFQSGQIGVEKNYRNGEMDGKWTYYDGKGGISSEHNYIDGKREGKWIWYRNNGQIKSKKITLMEKYKTHNK